MNDTLSITIRDDGATVILATSDVTEDFAHRNPAGKWPCSALAGHPVRIVLAANGDLIGDYFPEDVLAEELAAFIEYAQWRHRDDQLTPQSGISGTTSVSPGAMPSAF
jgi:hypothetical protein